MSLLANFTELAYIDTRGSFFDQSLLQMFMDEMNEAFPARSLSLKVSKVYRPYFEKEIRRLNSIFTMQDTSQRKEISDRNSRESTPEEFADEEEEFMKYKLRVKKGVKQNDMDGCYRDLLSMFGLDQKYKTSLCLDYDKSLNVDETVNWLRQKFIHALIISNDGCWIIITQLEIYHKDRRFDDCSNNSPVPTTKKAINVMVEKKGEGRQWVELKIFVGNYELLVTGAIVGFAGDTKQFDGFLGASAHPALYDEQYWLAYFPETIAATTNDFRLLRDFQRRDSCKRWSSKSSVFAESGFVTASPFNLDDGMYQRIASILLSATSRQKLDSTIITACIVELESGEFWKSFGFEERPSDNTELIRKVMAPNLGVTKKKLVSLLYGFKQEEILKIMVPALKKKTKKLSTISEIAIFANE